MRLLTYFRRALFARLRLPGIGPVPLNLILAASLAALVPMYPWVAGAGLFVELSLLGIVAANPRFQRWADGMALLDSALGARREFERRRDALLNILEKKEIDRWERFYVKCRSLEELAGQSPLQGAGPDITALRVQRVAWLFLKLLIARHHLLAMGENTALELQKKISELDSALQKTLDGGIRSSMEETKNLLKERLERHLRRAVYLQQVQSDLAHLEAHINLANDNALLEVEPPSFQEPDHLATPLVDFGYFGASREQVRRMDDLLSLSEPARPPLGGGLIQ